MAMDLNSLHLILRRGTILGSAGMMALLTGVALTRRAAFTQDQTRDPTADQDRNVRRDQERDYTWDRDMAQDFLGTGIGGAGPSAPHSGSAGGGRGGRGRSSADLSPFNSNKCGSSAKHQVRLRKACHDSGKMYLSERRSHHDPRCTGWFASGRPDPHANLDADERRPLGNAT